MPDPLTRLVALTMTQGTPTPAVLTRAHTAAYLLGQSERTGVSLAAFKGLSKAERADIKRTVEGQLGYLRKFKADMAGMSEQAIAARAAKYAGALRETYSRARHPGLPFYPCQGTECQTNCKCSWRDDGDGSYTWVMAASEHCATCSTRASGSPYKVGE